MKELQPMIEFTMDKLDTQIAPPTPEAIEQIRQKQLKALKALRRELLKLHRDGRSAA